MSEFPRLVQISPKEGVELPVREPITVGRENTDVVLDDPEASRRHASLEVAGAGLMVRDLGSSNGTFVNGTEVTEHLLAEGDELRIGDTVWRAELGGAGATRIRERPPAAAPPPASPATVNHPRPDSVGEAPVPAPPAPPTPAPAPPTPAPPAPEPQAPAPPTPAPQASQPPEPRAPEPQVPPGPQEPGRPPLPQGPPVAAQADGKQLRLGDGGPSRLGGSAARRVEATVVSYAVIGATAIAVTVYLASR